MLLSTEGGAEDYGEQLRTCRNCLNGIHRSRGVPPRRLKKRVFEVFQALEKLAVDDEAVISFSSPWEDWQLDWLASQRLVFKAWHCVAAKPPEAREFLDHAIQALETQDSEAQIRRQGLYSLLAKARLLEKPAGGGPAHLLEALDHAQLSVSQKPESAARRWILAEVFSALGDVRQAQSEMQAALRLGGGSQLLCDAETVHRVGEESLRLARVCARLSDERDADRAGLLAEARRADECASRLRETNRPGRGIFDLGILPDRAESL